MKTSSLFDMENNKKKIENNKKKKTKKNENQSKKSVHFLACLNEVQEELLYNSWHRQWHQRSQNVKVFYVMDKALTGELSCPMTGLVFAGMFVLKKKSTFSTACQPCLGFNRNHLKWLRRHLTVLCVPTPISCKRMIAFLKVINEADLSWMYLERKGI